MDKYTGWTLYDKIKLVIREGCYYGYEYPQAYVVDANNKKQLEAAIRWAKGYSNHNYTIVETDNSEFTLKIIDCAHHSSQGGKLSFWNCLISKKEDNVKCIVGIDSTLLLKIIKSNTFEHGVCMSKLFFARCQGGVGMLSKNMCEYKEALNDMQSKTDINKKKTSKWQVGCNYKTLTIDSLYLGKITRLVRHRFADQRVWRGRNDYYSYEALFEEKPTQHICMMTKEIDNSKITKMSQLTEKWKNDIKSNTSKLLDKLENKGAKNVSFSELMWCVPLFSSDNMGDKLPARQQGDVHIEIDVDLNKAYTEIIELMQDSVIMLYNKGVTGAEYYVDELLIRVGETKIEKLSDRESKLLSMMEYSDNINVEKIGLKNKDIRDNKEESMEKLISEGEELLATAKKFLEKMDKEK